MNDNQTPLNDSSNNVNDNLLNDKEHRVADLSDDHTLSTSSITDADISADDARVISKDGGYLELLEERPVINKERLDVGRVRVSKHTRTKLIEVPIELVEEYITITTDYNDSESQDLLSGNFDEKDILRHVEPTLDSKAVVTVNGQQVEIGDAPIEIVLSRQVATITKETYVIQEIGINKTVHTHTDTIALELKHEELDVKEEGFLAHDNANKTL